jgi:hypothetical protein
MSSEQAHNVQVAGYSQRDHVELANRIGEGLRDAGTAVDVIYDGVQHGGEELKARGYDQVEGNRYVRARDGTGSPTLSPPRCPPRQGNTSSGSASGASCS